MDERDIIVLVGSELWATAVFGFWALMVALVAKGLLALIDRIIEAMR